MRPMPVYKADLKLYIVSVNFFFQQYYIVHIVRRGPIIRINWHRRPGIVFDGRLRCEFVGITGKNKDTT